MTINTQRLRFLRGNSAAVAAFTGLQGELVFNTDTYTLHLQDGNTAGGFSLATSADLANIGGSNYGNANVASFLSSNSNVALITTGNVTASYLIGDGSLITGITTYGNSNVAAYLLDNPQPGTYSNTNVAAYLIANPQPGTYSDSNVAAYLLDNPQPGTYTNSNVATYLPVYGGNISIGNITLSGNTWTFNPNGSLDLPTNLSIIPTNTFAPINGTAMVQGAGDYISIAAAGAGGLMSLGWAQDTYAPGNVATVSFNDTDLGQVRVTTGDFNNTLYTWNFAPDGKLSIPGGGQVGPIQYPDGIDLYASGSMSYSQINYDNKNYVYADSGVAQLQTPNVYITADNLNNRAWISASSADTQQTSSWYFDANGLLTVPGSITSEFIASPAPVLSGFDFNGVNVTSSGNVFASGNVTGNNIIGNGSQLTDVNAATVDILNTNGLGTTFYPTFVEDRTTGQIIRADVDLSYRSDTNTLVVGNLQVGGSITGSLAAPGANTQVLFNNVGSLGGSSLFTFDRGSNTLTVGAASGTLKVADIQTPQAGVSLRLIPSTGISYSYGHFNPLFSNTYDLGQSGNRWQNLFANLTNLSTLVVSGNATANALSINNSVTIGTTLGVTGNIFGGNVLATTAHRWATGAAKIDLSSGSIQLTPDTAADALAGIIVGGNGYILSPNGSRNLTLNYNSVNGQVGVQTNLVVGTTATGGSITVANNVTVGGNITGNTSGFAIGYRDIPQVAFTSNATLVLTDAGKHYFSSNSANVITVPNNSTVSFNIGTAISIVQQGTASLTITPASGVTMYMAGNSVSSSRQLGSYGMATLMKVGTDTWFINGTGVS